MPTPSERQVVQPVAVESGWHGKLAAAVVGTAPLSPILAGLFTVVAVTAPLPTVPAVVPGLDLWGAFVNQHLLLAAFVNVFAAWLVLACFYWWLGFINPDTADARSYGSFCCRYSRLCARYSAIQPGTLKHTPGSLDPLAKAEIDMNLVALEQERSRRDVRWVVGYGYVNLWRSLNRAEEAFLKIAPLKLVRAEAHRDLLRLEGSTVPKSPERNALLAQLRTELSHTDETSTFEMRNLAYQVRHFINEYRMDRWIRLLQTRNRLFASIVFTSFTIYVLLWLGVAAKLQADALTGVTTIYFVGAIVGLFNRLYADWKAGTSHTGSDYGLALYELIGIPLLSGVAAVLGVLLTSAVLVGHNGVPGFTQVFSVETYPLNLMEAAIFGVAPGLVLSRLREEISGRTKKELRSLETHVDPETKPAKASR